MSFQTHMNFFLLYVSFIQMSVLFLITAASWKHVSCSLQAKPTKPQNKYTYGKDRKHTFTHVHQADKRTIPLGLRSNKAQAIKSNPCVLLNIAVNQNTQFKKKRKRDLY